MSLNRIKINESTVVNTGIVYDISKATGQSYETLSDALGTDGNNVPPEVREGGMSVRFVHTGDNKYMQCRLVLSTFTTAQFTNEINWQDINSDVDNLNNEVNGVQISPNWQERHGINVNTGVDFNNEVSNRDATGFIPIGDTKEIDFALLPISYISVYYILYYINANTEEGSFISSDGWKTDAVYPLTNVPTGANYIRVMIDNTVINNTDVTFVPNVTGIKMKVEELENSISDINTNIHSINEEIVDINSDIQDINDEINGIQVIWKEGVGVRTDIGEEAPNPERDTTSFILIGDIEEIDFVTSPKYFVVYYGSKEAESIVSSDGWKTDAVYPLTNVPTGANYIRVMIDNTVINNTAVTFVLNEKGIKESIERLNKDVYGGSINVNWAGEGKGIRVDTGADVDVANRNRTDFLSISEIGSIIFNVQTPSYYIVFYAVKETSSFISSFGWKNNTVYYPSVDKPADANYFKVLIDTTTVEPENIEVILLSHIKDVSIKVTKAFESILVVSADGYGDYTTIEAALAAAKDSINHHVTILIKPGIYTPAPRTPDNTPYQSGNRNISLIGLDRDSCILTGDVGYYYYQEGIDYGIIRLGGNVLIKNLTIISTCSQYETVATEKGWDLTNPHARAYCIHADYPYNQDGDVMRIENCKLYNDHFSCIGWGIRPHCELLIKDCEIIADVSIETELKSGFSNYGAIYGHLSGRLNAYNQKLSVIRCLIKNVNFDCGINQMLGISEFDEVSSQLKFIQNVVRTTNMQNAFINALVNGYPLVNTIDEMSYGNNVPSMNYNEL